VGQVQAEFANSVTGGFGQMISRLDLPFGSEGGQLEEKSAQIGRQLMNSRDLKAWGCMQLEHVDLLVVGAQLYHSRSV